MFVMLACYNFYEFDYEQTLQQCSQARFVILIAACVKKSSAKSIFNSFKRLTTKKKKKAGTAKVLQ